MSARLLTTFGASWSIPSVSPCRGSYATSSAPPEPPAAPQQRSPPQPLKHCRSPTNVPTTWSGDGPPPQNAANK
jgi:hypothetical protein